MCLFQLTYLSIHLSPSTFANLTLPLVSSSPNPQHLHFLILKVEDYVYTIQCTHFRHIAWRFQSEHACLNATLTRGWNITSTPETSFPPPAITPLGNYSRLPEPQVGFVCFWPIGRWSSTMLLRFGLPPERNTGTLVALRDDSRSPEWECRKRERQFRRKSQYKGVYWDWTHNTSQDCLKDGRTGGQNIHPPASLPHGLRNATRRLLLEVLGCTWSE